MARKAATGVNSMPSTVQVPQTPVERRVLREDWVVALDLKPQTLAGLEGNATRPDGDSQLNHLTRRDFFFLVMREEQLRWLAIAPAVLGNIRFLRGGSFGRSQPAAGSDILVDADIGNVLPRHACGLVFKGDVVVEESVAVLIEFAENNVDVHVVEVLAGHVEHGLKRPD